MLNETDEDFPKWVQWLEWTWIWQTMLHWAFFLNGCHCTDSDRHTILLPLRESSVYACAHAQQVRNNNFVSCWTFHSKPHDYTSQIKWDIKL
jgi:hypothetical protein